MLEESKAFVQVCAESVCVCVCACVDLVLVFAEKLSLESTVRAPFSLSWD